MQTGQTDTRQRNREIFEYHQAHPEMNLAELGERYGLTQQRLSQLIRSQLCRTLIKQRNQMLARYYDRHVVTGEGVPGELFAVTRPKEYYRVQQAIRKRTCLVCEVDPISRTE